VQRAGHERHPRQKTPQGLHYPLERAEPKKAKEPCWGSRTKARLPQGPATASVAEPVDYCWTVRRREAKGVEG
jgi:hypothetical protein